MLSAAGTLLSADGVVMRSGCLLSDVTYPFIKSRVFIINAFPGCGLPGVDIPCCQPSLTLSLVTGDPDHC